VLRDCKEKLRTLATDGRLSGNAPGGLPISPPGFDRRSSAAKAATGANRLDSLRTVDSRTTIPRMPRNFTVYGLALLCLLAAGEAAAQAPAAASSAPARLWRDPAPIAQRDLRWGNGAQARTPKPPFRFVEEDKGGSQPKVTVTDAGGTTWDVKFGVEVPAEIASNRIVWALGYLVEEMYHVGSGVIQGVTGLKRAADHVGAGGAFKNARFRRVDARARRTDEPWTFQQNPFLGTKEMSGLVILMNLINNWDIDKALNNRVVLSTLPGGTVERWFIVSDLGATFGKMGGSMGQKTKWNLKDYIAEDFIERVHEGKLHLDYEGFESKGLGEVPLEHARWFTSLAVQLTPAQLRNAFETAGASAQEVEGYSSRLMAKIAELRKAIE
jgi:hypothetical protein